MDKKDASTEKKILDAAREEFLIKGMDGTRTKEIADRAGINKALLHYYYRTKELLFMAVFKKVAGTIIPDMGKVFNSEMSLFEIIEVFTKKYIQLLQRNPFLPGFIIHEINRHPDRLAEVLKTSGLNIEAFLEKVIQAQKDGVIRKTDPDHLLVNMVSMCVFPVISRPILIRIVFSNKNDKYQKFMADRASHVAEFINNSIKI